MPKNFQVLIKTLCSFCTPKKKTVDAQKNKFIKLENTVHI